MYKNHKQHSRTHILNKFSGLALAKFQAYQSKKNLEILRDQFGLGWGPRGLKAEAIQNIMTRSKSTNCLLSMEVIWLQFSMSPKFLDWCYFVDNTLVNRPWICMIIAYADPVCTCGAGGPGSLIYKPDYENDCTRYSQYVGEGEPSNIFIDCAADLIFDVVTCNCNYRYAASCDPACKGTVW